MKLAVDSEIDELPCQGAEWTQKITDNQLHNVTINDGVLCMDK